MGVRFVEAVHSITNEAAEKLHSASYSDKGQEEDVDSASTSAYNHWAEWLTVQEEADTPNRNLIEPGQTQAWPVSQSVAGLRSSWQAFDDDMFQSASFLPQHRAVEAGTYHWLDGTDQDFLSGLHSDGQTLLMGLTGLDALDFSG
jgi:hypothetical protein